MPDRFDRERYQVPSGLTPAEQWFSRRVLQLEIKVEKLERIVQEHRNDLEQILRENTDMLEQILAKWASYESAIIPTSPQQQREVGQN